MILHRNVKVNYLRSI